MPPEIEYLVVIKPAPPKAPTGITQGVGYANTPAPIRVKNVRADGPVAAAEKAGVRAGETAMVCEAEAMHMYQRPELAPLVEAA